MVAITIMRMSCFRYQKLTLNWKLLVYYRDETQATVDAYWRAVEHRIFCEVCRDEALVQGCFGTYLMVASSLARESNTKHDSTR